jgi:hypothetical protein
MIIEYNSRKYNSVSVLSDISEYTISTKIFVGTLHAPMKRKVSIIASSSKCTYDVGTRA